MVNLPMEIQILILIQQQSPQTDKTKNIPQVILMITSTLTTHQTTQTEAHLESTQTCTHRALFWETQKTLNSVSVTSSQS